MKLFGLPSDFSRKAQEVWAEYERTHDLRGMEMLAVGIDPDSREVFFGTSAKDIVQQLTAAGQFRPLFFRWVNRPNYHRHGRGLLKALTLSTVVRRPGGN
jgi:hypothetical protein